MVHSKFKKKIGTIGTIGANMNRQNILMIFLLQDCSEEVFDTRKAKVQCFKAKDLDSSSFMRKINQPNVLTVGGPFNGRIGLDFKDMQSVLEIIRKENDPVIALLLTDAEKRTTENDQSNFGPTLGDQIGTLEVKYERNPEQLQIAARKILIDRKRAIENSIEAFEGQEKGILTKQDPLSFVGVKGNWSANLLRFIGHKTNKVDIVFQRNGHENIISFSKQAKQYLPSVLKALRTEEPTCWKGNEEKEHESDFIRSNPNNLTRIQFNSMFELIKRAAMEFTPTETETSAKVNGNGTHMPVREGQHSGTMHHIPVMAEAPVLAATGS